MGDDTDPHDGLSRRTVLQSAGGMAALSMSGATLAEARAQGALEDLPTDPHTLDVFRSIVDAIVPETPELSPPLGENHEPGALAVDLERFLVWDFNHFQEVRAETLTHASRERFEAAFPGDALDGPPEAPAPGAGPVGTLDPLSGGFDLAPSGIGDRLDDATTAATDLVDVLDTGALDRFEVAVDAVPDAGPVDLAVLVEADGEPYHRVMQNYPYAEALATAFEVIAAEYVLTGRNDAPPMPVNDRFPAGGLFVRLQPHDRLRCLDTIINGGLVDRLDDAIGAVLPTLGVLKFAVMGVFGLATLGYYSEWPAYGDTKTATPNDRSLEADPGDVLGRQQTEYPGPAPGYPAHRGFEVQQYRENDWRADR